MTKYYVIHCKSLSNNTVFVNEFQSEIDATTFAEINKRSGNIVFISKNGVKTSGSARDYKMKIYGAYPFYKYVYSYIALVILFGLCGFVYLLIH